MEENTCPNCGTPNPTNSKYCKSCGKTLPKIEIQSLKEPKNKNESEPKSTFEIIMEIANWLLIFISPFLVCLIAGIIIYLNNPQNNWLPQVLILFGAILGVLLAERIRRKYGTTAYMGRLKGNSEFIDEKKDNKKSN